MNRFDEIHTKARRIAERFCGDPDECDAVARELTEVITLIVSAVGKGVAVDGESAMNLDDEDDTAFARYMTGEAMQDQAGYVSQKLSEARPAPEPVEVTCMNGDRKTVRGPGEPGAAATRVVAYRSSFPEVLYCLDHGGVPSDTGVTSEDLPDGGLCHECGRDVLAVSDE